jgi:hypothetical protein
MPSSSQPNAEEDDGLEAAVDQAIAACGGDMQATIRALIVANDYLESEVSELMKTPMPAADFTPIPAERRKHPKGQFRLKTAVASFWFCCTTELLPSSPRARLRPRPAWQGPRPKGCKQAKNVQTNPDRKSRRDRLPGHQDCPPDGD